MIDIFNKGKNMTVSWFYFKEIGDKVQGTYIGKKTGVKDSFGNDQIVYILETADGIKNVGFKTGQRINKDMELIKLGQIIGFHYQNRAKFFNKILKKEQECKNMVLWADSKIVDQAWIDSHPDGVSDVAEMEVTPGTDSDDELEDSSTKGFGDFDDVEAPVAPVAPVAEVKSKISSVAPEELMRLIVEQAKTSLGVSDVAQVKPKVEEVTGLVFTPANFEKILEMLRTY